MGWTCQDQDQDSLLVKRRNDNHSPRPVIREFVREVNLATQSSASSVDEIRESRRAFQSLIVWGKKLPLLTSVLAMGSKKIHVRNDQESEMP